MSKQAAPNESEIETLEGLVDKYGLSDIVYSLATICSIKADHIRSSYDDKVTASAWQLDQAKLHNCSIRLHDSH